MQDYLQSVLKRKEKYLQENPEYRRQEALAHRHLAGKYIGDLIYGANDGIITTFAIVAGVAGASLPGSIVIILGLANVVADGISMGASNYLGEKSERDYAKFQRQKEEWEIEHLRELEVEEIKEIYESKGFKGKDLDRTVEIITSDKKVWLDTMMTDELGILDQAQDDPKKHGFITFAAFVVAGMVPLTPYLIPNLSNQFFYSTAVGVVTLFTVGALRSLVTTVNWFRGGLEMLLIGSGAALTAYLVGAFIDRLIS